LRWLAAGTAEIVQVNLEDLWKETQPQNVPGTSTERPNWRRKTKLTVEEIEGSEELAGFLRELTRLRER
jgi:4-alpha-glucanotransferase